MCFGFVFAVWDMSCFDFCEDDIFPVDSRKCRKYRLFAFEPISDTFVSNGVVGGVYLKPSKIFFIAFRVDKRYFRTLIDFSADSGMCRNYRFVNGIFLLFIRWVPLASLPPCSCEAVGGFFFGPLSRDTVIVKG